MIAGAVRVSVWGVFGGTSTPNQLKNHHCPIFRVKLSACCGHVAFGISKYDCCIQEWFEGACGAGADAL